MLTKILINFHLLSQSGKKVWTNHLMNKKKRHLCLSIASWKLKWKCLRILSVIKLARMTWYLEWITDEIEGNLEADH